MATTIPKGSKCPIGISNFRDIDGNVVPIDAITSVTVSDPSKSEILDEGGQLFVAPLLTGNPAGDGQQVIYDVDVRVGAGVVSKLFIGTFDVPAGEAVTADVTLGAVVPR